MRLKLFPNKVRDIRVDRIQIGDNTILATPRKDYNIQLVPIVKIWVNKSSVNDSTDIVSVGIFIVFWYWTVDIFDCSYKKISKEPWVENGKRQYITSRKQWEEDRKLTTATGTTTLT